MLLRKVYSCRKKKHHLHKKKIILRQKTWAIGSDNRPLIADDCLRRIVRTGARVHRHGRSSLIHWMPISTEKKQRQSNRGH